VEAQYIMVMDSDENSNDECFRKAEKESKNATEWIENALKYYKQFNFITYDELENREFVNEGGFGHITKAIWTKTNDYVICKKLTNTTNIKHGLLKAFIHELKIHLRLDYSDRIVRCLGISIGNLNYYYYYYKYNDLII
jgi:serine/threonine protein kinase